MQLVWPVSAESDRAPPREAEDASHNVGHARRIYPSAVEPTGCLRRPGTSSRSGVNGPLNQAARPILLTAGSQQVNIIALD